MIVEGSSNRRARRGLGVLVPFDEWIKLGWVTEAPGM